MSLPLRTAKYTLAVLAAALTAQALGLLNPMTAGHCPFEPVGYAPDHT